MKPMHRPTVFLSLLACLLVTACASLNPFAYAKTPLDKAFTALSTLEIAQQEVLTVISAPGIPAGVIKALQVVSHDAALAADQLGQTVIEVEAARAALAAGQDANQRLAIANENLVTWTNTVLARITSIKAALKEAKSHGN